MEFDMEKEKKRIEEYFARANMAKMSVLGDQEEFAPHGEENEQSCPDDWENLKAQGSAHYKTGGVEPVDLYLAGGMFEEFALCSIIKYAFRQRMGLNSRDLDKIIDYAEKLKATMAPKVGQGKGG